MNLLLGLALLAEGDGSFYAKNVMESTVAYRIELGQIQPCPDCIGYVALMSCDELGRLVYLDFGDSLGIEGPFLTADCAQAEHIEGLRKRNRVVEVDWQTALRHHMAGPLPVRILWAPPENCPAVGSC
jgi:hypothetical protein